jgi:hypothetical protein
MKITVIKKANPTRKPNGAFCPWMIDEIPTEKK